MDLVFGPLERGCALVPAPNKASIAWTSIRTLVKHGRRNFRLRAEGVLSIVCPVVDDSEIKGICIFDVSVDETRRIMDEDPGVRAGIFVYETHLCRGFPGDSLAR